MSYLSDPWPWTRTLRRVGGKLRIVGEDRAAVAEASERLGREKAGRGGKADRAEATALVGGAKTLRGVVENEHPLGFGDRGDRIMIRGLPEQIDRNDRSRLQTLLLGDRDAVLQRIGIDIERRLIDIDEDRRGAETGPPPRRWRRT